MVLFCFVYLFAFACFFVFYFVQLSSSDQGQGGDDLEGNFFLSESFELKQYGGGHEENKNKQQNNAESSTDLKRSASQGSLHSANQENDNLLSATRQESKNRLSFKMVRQTMKVSGYRVITKCFEEAFVGMLQGQPPIFFHKFLVL